MQERLLPAIRLHYRHRNLKMFLRIIGVIIGIILFCNQIFMFFPCFAGLFHRAISQSGTGHCPWTLTRPGTAKKHAKVLGEHLNCPTGSSKDLIACLLAKKAVDIIGVDHLFQVIEHIQTVAINVEVKIKSI